MRRAEAVEEVEERDARLERRRLRDEREVVRLLHASWSRASPSRCPRGHDVAVIAEDRERVRGQRARAATWKTAGVSSPAILYMFGIISSRPCDAVNVVVSDPVCSAPCTAPAAPPSLCISTTCGTVPQMFGLPSAAHWSANSPIVEDGVIG